MRALSRDPAARQATVTAFADEVEAALAGQAAETPRGNEAGLFSAFRRLVTRGKDDSPQ